jgi:hypothetical protein
MKAVCPRCGQGVLLIATIKASREEVVVCDECEALWAGKGERSATNFQDLLMFLKSKGVEGAWEALVIENTGNAD